MLDKRWELGPNILAFCEGFEDAVGVLLGRRSRPLGSWSGRRLLQSVCGIQVIRCHLESKSHILLGKKIAGLRARGHRGQDSERSLGIGSG